MMNAYGATKGGLIQLTRCVAVDLAPDVRVNCYCPASVYTNMVKKFTEAAEDKEAVESFMVAQPSDPAVRRAGRGGQARLLPGVERRGLDHRRGLPDRWRMSRVAWKPHLTPHVGNPDTEEMR